MEIISRNDAIVAGLKTYFTGKTCKHGHLDTRRVDSRCCTYCLKSQSRNWKANNNKHVNEYRKEYYWKDPDKEREKVRIHREENLEHYKSLGVIQRKRHYHKILSYNAKRRASKLKRTPPWLTKDDFNYIESLYKNAHELSAINDEPYHVDHIIPLQGKLVSGLHVPSNLRVIPCKENLSKGNKYEI